MQLVTPDTARSICKPTGAKWPGLARLTQVLTRQIGRPQLSYRRHRQYSCSHQAEHGQSPLTQSLFLFKLGAVAVAVAAGLSGAQQQPPVAVVVVVVRLKKSCYLLPIVGQLRLSPLGLVGLVARRNQSTRQKDWLEAREGLLLLVRLCRLSEAVDHQQRQTDLFELAPVEVALLGLGQAPRVALHTTGLQSETLLLVGLTIPGTS